MTNRSDPESHDLVVLGGQVRRNRILGFTLLGVEAGGVMAAGQVPMRAGLPYPVLCDAVLTHPTMQEGLVPLFSVVPARAA